MISMKSVSYFAQPAPISSFKVFTMPEFMRKYIPAEIADTLTLDEWNAIIEAWKIETSKGGKTAGE